MSRALSRTVGCYPNESGAIPNRRPLSQRVGRYPGPSAAIPACRTLSRTVGRYPNVSGASAEDLSCTLSEPWQDPFLRTVDKRKLSPS